MRATQKIQAETVWTIAAVEKRLIEAVTALRHLRGSGSAVPAKFKSAWPEIVRSVIESYGWTRATYKPPVPSAVEIDNMDESLQWLYFVTREDRRRILLARIHGSTWRRISARDGRTEPTLRKEYRCALNEIANALNTQPL